jgi:hypothetical protein
MNPKRSGTPKTPKRTSSPRNKGAQASLPQDAPVLADAAPLQAASEEVSKARRIQGYETDWQRWDRLAQQLGDKKESQAALFHYLLQIAEAQIPKAGLNLESGVLLENKDELPQEQSLTEFMAHIPPLLSAMTSLTLQFQQQQQQQQQLNLLLAQVLQALTSRSSADFTTSPRKASSASAATVRDSFSTLDSQNLKKSHAKGSAEEKLKRAFEAIVAHNEAPNRSHADKWAINQNALAELTGCNRPAIKHFLKQYAADIERQHQTHNLLPRHNYAHGKLGTKITDVISW